MNTSTLGSINDFIHDKVIHNGMYNKLPRGVKNKLINDKYPGELDSEFCHNAAMWISKYAEKSDWILNQVREATHVSGEEVLQMEIADLQFPNPVGLAAGFTKAPYGLKFWESFGFGSITIGGITLEAQPGNNKQRIFRFGNDVVNGMGLPGNGGEETVKMLQMRQDSGNSLNIPLGANLCNSAKTKPEDKIDEFKNEMDMLYPYVDYFEINISCPNQAGVCGLTEQLEKILSELTKYNDELALKYGKKNKLFVKISPLSQDADNPKDGTVEGLKSIADVCNQYNNDGVHAVIATNTAQEHNYTDQTQIWTPNGDIITGGASGKQIQETSLNTVKELRKVLHNDIAIIGVGGIGYDEPGKEGQSAVNMQDVGADSVQLYTSFVNKSVLTPMQAKQAILKEMQNVV